MIESVLSLSGIGMTAAIALGIAAKKFAVEVDPRELAILEALPGANCGACGFPGCAGYAKALVEGTVDPNMCPPGGNDLVVTLGNILGIDIEASEPQVAIVLCQGDNVTAKNKYQYLGLNDCTAAQKIAGGPKVCSAGCIGLGSCQKACPFNAIKMTDNGLAVIIRENCTGCRKCVIECPRQVIQMVPESSNVHVLCNSHDKGALVRKNCNVGCIGCQICVKIAPHSFEIDNFLAKSIVTSLDSAGFFAAIDKCPTKCIHDLSKGYPKENLSQSDSSTSQPNAA